MCDNALPVWRGEGTIQDEIGGKRRSKAKRAARGRSMKKKSTQSRGGVKGGIPPCRVKGRRPLWGLGQRPNRCLSKLLKGNSQQGAGSEASLPVTLRSRRSAPKLLYPSTQHCRARWARPDCMTFDHSRSFPQAEGFASAEATRGQWKQTKSAVAPLTPSGCTLPYSIFIGRLYSYCSTIFSLTFISTQGDNHHVRIYRRSRVRKNDQFLSP